MLINSSYFFVLMENSSLPHMNQRKTSSTNKYFVINYMLILLQI